MSEFVRVELEILQAIHQAYWAIAIDIVLIFSEDIVGETSKKGVASEDLSEKNNSAVKETLKLCY